MTPDQPSGADLLETAAHRLRQEILPDAPAHHRLSVLMILSAMGMAERELRVGGAQAGEWPAALQRLLGEESVDASSVDVITLLARRIRAGDFDVGPEAEVLHTALSADVRHRLSIANPKYLARAEKKS